MEARFGVGFGDVRIHDAPEDRTAARRIGARAFTWLRHIWLGPGESVEDRRLMAHELTHVTQQTPRQAAPDAARAVAEPEVRRASWIAEEAESYARDVPGYTLISVILGESPITGDACRCTAENLIGGFLGLIPGGNLLFEQLKESRVLQDAFDWVSAKLSELNITWTRISSLIDEVIDTFPTWSPVAEIERMFAPVVATSSPSSPRSRTRSSS